MDITIKTDTDGPIFDGRADLAVSDFIEEAEQAIGDMGVTVIRSELDRVLKRQTGYYRSRIEAEPRMGDVVLHDNKVIYGWWLEGVGSRNSPVTRFKGYATFRRMKQVIQARAKQTAESVLPKYLRRMQ